MQSLSSKLHGRARASLCACTLAGAGLIATEAEAAPIPCSTALSNYADNAYALNIAGTRVTLRGDSGHVGFTMHQNFEIEATPLHTPASTAQRWFFAPASGTTAYTGYFSTVFTDRGNVDEDSSQFWVYTTGSFYIRSITWGGGWQLLQNTACFEGDGEQIVVTGRLDEGNQHSFWTLLIVPSYLI